MIARRLAAPSKGLLVAILVCWASLRLDTWIDTRFYGEKRLQPSRSKKHGGRLVSSRTHYTVTHNYLQFRRQERIVVHGKFSSQKLPEEEKHFSKDSHGWPQVMHYVGLPADRDLAWAQLVAHQSPTTTFRYIEISPDPILIQILMEQGLSHVVEPYVCHVAEETMRQYSQDKYNTDGPAFLYAYHEKYDQYRRPQPHIHLLCEGTAPTPTGERIEFKFYKEQLAAFKRTLQEVQEAWLDRHLDPEQWRQMYEEKQRAFEQLKQEILAQALTQIFADAPSTLPPDPNLHLPEWLEQPKTDFGSSLPFPTTISSPEIGGAPPQPILAVPAEFSDQGDDEREWIAMLWKKIGTRPADRTEPDISSEYWYIAVQTDDGLIQPWLLERFTEVNGKPQDIAVSLIDIGYTLQTHQSEELQTKLAQEGIEATFRYADAMQQSFNTLEEERRSASLGIDEHPPSADSADFALLDPGLEIDL